MKRILISLLVLSMAGQVDCQAQFVKKLSEAWKKVKTTVNTLSESQKSKTTTATPSTTTGTSSGTKNTAATPTKVAGLDIKMPQVVKVVKVTSATLNIRKSASATAPFLKRWCEYETDNCLYVWNNEKTRRGDVNPCPAEQGNIYAVIEELPEWYKVLVCNETCLVGYISKKYTTEVTLTPLTPALLCKPFIYFGDQSQIVGRTSGAYKGYALIDENGWETEGVSIGRIVGNLLVRNVHHSGVVSPGEGNERLTIKNEENYLSIQAGTSLQKQDNEGSTMVNVNGFTDAEFAKIMDVMGAKPGVTSNEGMIWGMVEGNIICLGCFDLNDPALSSHAVLVKDADIVQ